ncbi:MAG: aspartate kinase [Gemmatimonadales bacterium]|nr:aspartate kinase [Gemmatimonadales bacterium]
MVNRQAGNISRVLVRKYGGSSLASVERIQTVATDIALARKQGHQVVVVVSAMGETTNELTELAHQANPNPPRREMDMLLSVGERITMSLLAMALATEGCQAISFTGSQCGIITDGSHTDARIIEVRGDRVRDALAEGLTVIVAGFQGVSLDKEITTLGRGGSDTTAVALAAALGAERCEILKDVPGVMSADPTAVPDSWRHEQLSWDELRGIASSGCGVVHIRAVEYAAEHQVPLRVGSSFEAGPGTRIGAVSSIGEVLDSPHCGKVSTLERRSRYRPLVMTMAHDITRLRVWRETPDTEEELLPRLLERLDTTGIITEWLDSRHGFRWEVLAPSRILTPVQDAVETFIAARGPESVSLLVETDLTCISLAGGRPDSWLEVQRQVAEVLLELEVTEAGLRADGSALRILVRGKVPAEIPSLLHKALLES